MATVAAISGALLLLLAALSAAAPSLAQNSSVIALNPIFSGPQAGLQRALVAYVNANALYASVNVSVTTRFSGPAQDAFLSGSFDFVVADIPLEDGRLSLASAPLVQFPVFAGAVQFHHNIPGYNQELRLDACTLAGIYAGTITTWDHPDVLRRNPSLLSRLPGGQRQITPIGRNDASNFTTLVTEYLAKGCPSVWTVVNQTISWPAAVRSVGGNALVPTLANTTGSIVYLDLTAAPTLPAALANSAIAIQTPGLRYWVTATTGTFDSAGYAATEGGKALPSPHSSWANVSLVWEQLAREVRLPGGRLSHAPQAAQRQYPIAFLAYFVGYADLRPWVAKGVLAREYSGLLLGPYVQNASRLASYGWRPLPPAFREAALRGSLGLQVEQPVALPNTWY